MAGHALSKSRILSGWQCHKRLWLEIHDPGQAVVTPAAERAFAIGHRVGDAAPSLFPDGVLIGETDFKIDGIWGGRSDGAAYAEAVRRCRG